MSTAAELLVDPKVFASIKAEFHEVFVQQREEVRKLRSEMRPSTSAQSGRDRHHTASKDGTHVGAKRSREGKKWPVQPLERPMVIEEAPNTSSGHTKGQYCRDLWENHTFAELSPTGTLQAVRKIRVKEEMYVPLRAWKEVEEGISAYEYVLAQDNDLHPQIIIEKMHAIEFVKLIVSGLATSGELCPIAMKSLPLKR